MRRLLPFLLVLSGSAFAQRDVPVPSSCTAQVNAHLANLIQSGEQRKVDNVMVCGIATRNSRYAYGHGGAHHRFSILAHTPVGDKLIEIDSNDDLDGPVNATRGDTIFAYGQAYFDNRGQFAAGIHDVHCATHRGADNGWIVVNGAKHPPNCPNRY